MVAAAITITATALRRMNSKGTASSRIPARRQPFARSTDTAVLPARGPGANVWVAQRLKDLNPSADDQRGDVEATTSASSRRDRVDTMATEDQIRAALGEMPEKPPEMQDQPESKLAPVPGYQNTDTLCRLHRRW